MLRPLPFRLVLRWASTVALAVSAVSLATTMALRAEDAKDVAARPNILFAISDDQSHPHASAYGCRFVSTPAFDRVARRGVLFRQAFSPTPGCSPTRAALLTGRHAWQIEHAGTHASSFAAKYRTFPDRLEDTGYFVGYTGKGWGPGNWKDGGRTRNPAGPAYQGAKLAKAKPGMSRTDYASNFERFLADRPEDAPFCFWYGASEPHRVFDKGSGLRAGKTLESAEVPAFLPDLPGVRGDLLDYAVEIEWFDRHLGRMLDALETRGELDNTLVIVTSDNGMAFPRAKANLYEFGIHMPLAIQWPAAVPKGRTVDDLVGFVDLTATIVEAARVVVPAPELAGRSLMPILRSKSEGIVDPTRDAVFAARERHSSSRYRSLGYPQRAIRTHRFLYIRNVHSERWPAGTPQKYGRGGYPKPAEVRDRVLGPEHGGYHDIDACPTLTLMIEKRDDPAVAKTLRWAVDRRPAEELFAIQTDPSCLENLAKNPEYAKDLERLRRRLDETLRTTGDPRAHGRGEVFETYPRYSRLRYFPTPDWAQSDPSRVPEQPWWDQRSRAVR